MHTDTIPSPATLVDALNDVFGPQNGSRASHAKGLFVEGEFVANGRAAAITRAPHLQAGQRSDVLARFSVGGGNPRASDKARSVRGLALRFAFDEGSTDLVMMSAPVFFIKHPAHFVDYFQARRADPATGQPDPQRIAAFNAAHPDTRPHIDHLAATAPPASYATTPYFAIHAFRFIDKSDQTVHARWRLEPVAGRIGLDEAQLATMPDDFLANELAARLAVGPAEFDLWLQIAEDGDALDDPTMLWPAERAQLNVGRLRLNALVNPEQDVMFNPVALVDGIEASNDPVLRARLAVYRVSRERRS